MDSIGLIILQIPTRRKTNILKRSVIASLYYIFIKNWLSVFPRDQFVFIKSEDYFNDRTFVIMEIIDFLQLSKLRYW
ncbi:hypothetical protein LSH36_503g04026 [Paralvinella palmiformis]|uniref:Sulfotransferase domain-containing protein n=1 Tax=Paralvinella palmiformis TaxID=53620 RepID=A0AAD9J9A4_9ANNE|nr:hypothetical protein LSH36_503g04026 [Paralvinella palmiformis]